MCSVTHLGSPFRNIVIYDSNYRAPDLRHAAEQPRPPVKDNSFSSDIYRIYTTSLQKN